MQIPCEMLKSTLFRRGCVNGCCGCEVSMLWLALPVSPQPASVCPWGAIDCFLLLGHRGNGCQSAEGQEGGGILAPHCPSIICGWPISTVSSEGGKRTGRGTGQNHRLTEVPWWVELGVWFPNAVPLLHTYTHTQKKNSHTHTHYLPAMPSQQIPFPLNISLTGVRSMCVCVCLYVFTWVESW